MSKARAACGFITTATVSGLLVALPALPSQAAGDCPTALPTSEAVDGLEGTGYTVERGTTPDPFGAKLLGRITDGIAPGVDMIMADLDSPALERAGGVWAGMSGSPVYTSDGKLIGSVSYGLTAASNIAGITPAEDLTALGAGSGAAATVKVSGHRAARLAKTGETSKALAAKGFERLPVPVSASGIARRHTKRFLKSVTAGSGMAVRSGGARIGVRAQSSPDEIFAGSNYAAALSYGDISLTGLGTTTYVCNGTAVAFGHPFLSAGQVEYSVHPASAVLVQEDPTGLAGGPFKVGNPGGVVGTVTRDNTTGLRSTLGQAPAHQFPVTTLLKNESGQTISGTTVGVYQTYAADIAALHLQAAVVKALGAQGGGSAAIQITVNGTRAGGKKFKLTHSDHFSDSTDVSYLAADSLYFMILPLISQSFEDVQITDVKISGAVTSGIQQYRVSRMQVKKNGAWTALKGAQKVTSGGSLALRATLTAYRSTKTVTVPLTVAVPKKSSGFTGTLTVTDGLSATSPDREPTSLDGLLKQINATASNDSVVARIDLDTPSGGQVSGTAVAHAEGSVSPYLKLLTVDVS
ncbi:hypothetical protein KIH74_19630 [Kineosporia sp. J2-2]|uniref:Peptidase S55 domain-containing protein n=1 Tax=Kineosporia corallincola TaxID=2835133 RepID=A0ABS5TLW0_9ACTN|nr:SpoIVB peptidase S55 domain-containing protein [Kineosporia corallincola]MBT0771161.1 hypothetical protein [Kineosporia corallincola]